MPLTIYSATSGVIAAGELQEALNAIADQNQALGYELFRVYWRKAGAGNVEICTLRLRP